MVDKQVCVYIYIRIQSKSIACLFRSYKRDMHNRQFGILRCIYESFLQALYSVSKDDVYGSRRAYIRI